MATLNTFTAKPTHPPVPGPFPRGVRTLIVNDTPAILDVLSTILRGDPRINVVGAASNGLAAVALAQAQRPDLILMDINMPRMNGLKATMHIKRRLPKTKILLMSAEGDPNIALAAMDCGADGFIPKQRWSDYAWHVRRLFFSID
jgi:DNA-binding NarL/FixJ family response regulator